MKREIIRVMVSIIAFWVLMLPAVVLGMQYSTILIVMCVLMSLGIGKLIVDKLKL